MNRPQYVPTLYNVVPEAEEDEGKIILDQIRHSDFSLTTAMEIATKNAIKHQSVPRFAEELRDGHSYFRLEYSPTATRIRGNVQTPNAGEVYLIQWIWDKEHGEFYNIDAWGGINYKKFKSGTLLFE